jgi:hypothetical protein
MKLSTIYETTYANRDSIRICVALPIKTRPTEIRIILTRVHNHIKSRLGAHFADMTNINDPMENWDPRTLKTHTVFTRFYKMNCPVQAHKHGVSPDRKSVITLDDA